MRTAAMRLNMWMLSEFEAKNTFYLKKILSESKAEIREFPQEVLTQLKQYTDEVLADVTEADPFAKKVYDSYDKFRKDAVEWSKLTEKVFYNKIQI